MKKLTFADGKVYLWPDRRSHGLSRKMFEGKCHFGRHIRVYRHLLKEIPNENTCNYHSGASTLGEC